MGSYSGTREIVEARDELNSIHQSRGTSRSHSGLSSGGNDRKPPMLKPGYKHLLEDDINQLFEAISLKNSSKAAGLSSQASASTSPIKKNAMKRPITVGIPHSSGIGNSEPLSLKQALREVCISKASEMAAMKRLSMSSSSPRTSEARMIKSLYNSVVLETGRSSCPFDDSKGTMVEISLVPEESGSTSSGKMPRQLWVPKTKSSNQSALSSPKFQSLKTPNQYPYSARIVGQTTKDVAGIQSENYSGPREVGTQVLKSVDQCALTFRRSGAPKTQTGNGITVTQNEIGSSPRKVGGHVMKAPTQSAQSSPRLAIPYNSLGTLVSASIEFEIQAPKSPNLNALSSPRLTIPELQNDIDTATMENKIGSASRKVRNQVSKFPNKITDPSPPVSTTMQNGIGNSLMQKDIVPASRKVGTQALKTEMDRLTAATSPYSSVFVDSASKPDIKVPTSAKAASKASAPRSGRKVRLHAATSSVNRNRVSKVTKNATRLAKPVVRSKSSFKKKIKPGTTYSAAVADGGDNISATGTGQLVCQKCQCSLMNVTSESDKNFPASLSTALGLEVATSNVNHSASYPDLSSSNCIKGRDVGKMKKNPKSREKGEFSQSSKSSLGDYSTSTSNSEESNASRFSCSNRPHMSKDGRWEAIRHVKMRGGALSLRHFNLLRKLGCGDIGTVYLAELIGSNCLFAIKVMDNEFLARRKKTPRAQTEREILRILDHPFLPTLYAQFTSENLSCLVMEYCPGGDLHVLRQKQPYRSFSEPATRFYVAEVLLALEYLHMLGVIYRDLKPENILVREDGHIMLTDFDLSLRCSVSPTLLKSSSTDMHPARISGPCAQSSCIEPLCIEPSCQVPCFSPRILPAAKTRKLKADIASQLGSLPQLVAEPTDARSNSFVGTHEYLAPEIIKGEGHGAAVDWWTFGVFLYELLYGRTPFKGSENDETLANVVLQTLKFPDTPLVSFQARDLISGLLVKEPENRLGSEKGAAEIKQHPFFEGLNWALIRCATPPELPEFYNFGVPKVAASHDKNSKYLEFKATAEHLEFELF